MLANYQPIYQRGCDSTITVIKALRGSNNDDFGGDDDTGNNNPAVGDANDDRNSVDDDRDSIAGDNPPVTYISGDEGYNVVWLRRRVTATSLKEFPRKQNHIRGNSN